jgi:tripartite-type tricarboxylate transporter receptor subunit TctC
MRIECLFAGALAAMSVSFASAQQFPVKPVRLITSAAAGGPQDQSVRLLAEHLSSVWKERVLIENRPGASGLVAAKPVQTAAPDGYTLLVALPSLTSLPLFVKDPGLDPVKDFSPVSQISLGSMVMVINGDQPFKTVSEFIAYAKANPGKLNYSAGSGGQMLYFEHFKVVTGIDVRSVLYKGDPAAALGVASNDVQASFAGVSNVLPLMKTGKVRAVGVTTIQRSPATPDVPTIAESGVAGFDLFTWNGLLAPAKTPESIRNFVAAEIAVFTRKPETARAYARYNYEPRSSSPEQFGTLIKAEMERFAEAARRASITPE